MCVRLKRDGILVHFPYKYIVQKEQYHCIYSVEKIWILYVKETVRKRLRYNDNIVWPFGPCTIIQLFSLERAGERGTCVKVFPPYAAVIVVAHILLLLLLLYNTLSHYVNVVVCNIRWDRRIIITRRRSWVRERGRKKRIGFFLLFHAHLSNNKRVV